MKLCLPRKAETAMGEQKNTSHSRIQVTNHPYFMIFLQNIYGITTEIGPCPLTPINLQLIVTLADIRVIGYIITQIEEQEEF